MFCVQIKKKVKQIIAMYIHLSTRTMATNQAKATLIMWLHMLAYVFTHDLTRIQVHIAFLTPSLPLQILSLHF